MQNLVTVVSFSYHVRMCPMNFWHACTTLLLLIEYATSAGHYKKNMYTHRNEKKRQNTLEKNIHTLKHYKI